MPELTPRLGIKKPLGNENVTRLSFNENWDIIDAGVATKNDFDAHLADTTKHITSSERTAWNAKLDASEVVATAAPNKVLRLDSNGVLPANALSANRMQTARKITLTGDVGGNVYFDGSSDVELSTSLTTPVWYTLALVNGVQAYSTGATPKYTKIGNIVCVCGQVKNITGPVTIGYLPAGYRPSGAGISFIQNMSMASSTGARFARWYIGTDGSIAIEGVGGTSAGFDASYWFPIDVVFFI